MLRRMVLICTLHKNESSNVTCYRTYTKMPDHNYIYFTNFLIAVKKRKRMKECILNAFHGPVYWGKDMFSEEGWKWLYFSNSVILLGSCNISESLGN